MAGFVAIEQAADDVVKTLTGKKVEPRFLNFGGAGPAPEKEPRVPTDARSEFLANRAMGDWAEDCLAEALSRQVPKYKAVHYGHNDSISAGEPGFKEFYLARLEDVREFGKRPDLLLLPEDQTCPDDMPGQPTPELDEIVGEARAAIEVRSSKFEAETYMRVKRERAAEGKVSIRDGLSFTVKVEDLIIVYRWMERTNCEQLYAQVFFDSVYAINFSEIFAIVGSGDGFVIESPAKSQQKATIMIPITRGRRIGQFKAMPDFVVEERITQLGRHDAYVRPVGGDLKIDAEALMATIED